MNTQHKWAKEICHLANCGKGSVLGRVVGGVWFNVDLSHFECSDMEFCIKPESVYPHTSLDLDRLTREFESALMPARGLFKVANAAIKQYIIDTEEK